MTSIIRILYADDIDADDRIRACDYSPLLASFGYEILVQVDDDNYQGDSRVLYRSGSRYGILIFGWGSCRGCDSLKACDTVQEVEELRDSLLEGIQWFDDKDTVMQYLQSKDWSLGFLRRGETQQFVDECVNLLAENAKS